MGKKKPDVYVTRAIPEAGLELMREHCTVDLWEAEVPPGREILLDEVRGRDGLLCLLSDTIDAAIMDAAGPQLKVVSNYAVGFDNIDVDAATERGILVTNTPGVLTETTADFSFALLMAAARRVVEGVRYVQSGRWQAWGPRLLLGQDVHGSTLGIIGMGRIGKTLARRASGFDMEILYHDPHFEEEEVDGLKVLCAELNVLLRESDFVSLHVPLSEETHHMIDAPQLASMKPSAILINTARGAVVNTDALYEAIKNGEIAGAALDVTDPEPLPSDHKLLSLSNVLVCPHMASASVRSRTKMAVLAAENLVAGLKGKEPPHAVNLGVLGYE
jgi:glyoxylate reductase